MSRPADTTIHSLEEIMRVLANMRPGDRDDIMQAGSHLEEAIEFFKGNSTLVNDLINLAYKALIHMYEKDEFFFSIRAATLQAVNTIREFAVNEGDVAVEVFEKAYSELEKALKGGAESLMEQDVGVEQADTAGAPEQEVEAGSHPQDDTEVAPEQEAEAGSHPQDDTEVAPEQETASVGTSEVSGDEDSPEEVSLPVITLDDLASVIMQLTDDNINKSRLAQLDTIVNHLALHTAPNIAAIMQQLSEKLSGYEGASPDDANDLITFLSGKVEEAVALEMESEITTAQDGSAANHTPDAADLPAPDATANRPGSDAEPAQPAPDAAANQPGSDAVPAQPAPDATANQPGSDATASNAGDFPVPDDLDTDLLQDFVSECNEQIETAESALLDLEAAPDDAELINTVFRSFHTIKGTSAFMGLTPMSEFAHAVETLLDMVRDGHHNYDSACADITLTSIDIIKSLLEKSEVLQGGDVLTMPDDYAWLMDVLLRIAEFGKNPEEALAEVQGRQAAGTGKTEREIRTQTAADANLPAETGGKVSARGAEEYEPARGAEAYEPAGGVQSAAATASGSAQPGGAEVAGAAMAQSAAAAVSPSTREQNGQKGRETAATENGRAKRSESDASVRVNVERLDRVIDMVGELVIAHSVVAQSGLIASDPDLLRKVSHSSKILRELQDTSLSLRMVPLKATFQKMNRLVRDLAKKSGKAVTYGTEGEDTEIDRNMVDIINEPLVHLLRNALDHGIEDVEARNKSGKPGIARIWLRAFQAGGKVIIEIEDDGRGLDKEKILAKAVSKGLVEPNRSLNDSEIYKLIFLPGFSTADKVSDLSGRGVGMDVVRRSIDKLKGKVEVHSSPGKGTKISLELPFTLAITDGMLVRIGSQQFIVPTINIDMTFRAEQNELFTILGDSEQVRYRGNSIPVIRLHRMFGVRDAIENIEEATLLVINNNKKKYALLVDEVVGQQQLVGKSIDMPVKMRNISGGAILGDGRVGLILDTVALLN